MIRQHHDGGARRGGGGTCRLVDELRRVGVVAGHDHRGGEQRQFQADSPGGIGDEAACRDVPSIDDRAHCHAVHLGAAGDISKAGRDDIDDGGGIYRCARRFDDIGDAFAALDIAVENPLGEARGGIDDGINRQVIVDDVAVTLGEQQHNPVHRAAGWRKIACRNLAGPTWNGVGRAIGGVERTTLRRQLRRDAGLESCRRGDGDPVLGLANGTGCGSTRQKIEAIAAIGERYLVLLPRDEEAGRRQRHAGAVGHGDGDARYRQARLRIINDA